MFEFDALKLILIILLASFPAGFLISLALLRKTQIHILEKAAVGFAIGICLPPLLYFFEFFFLGIPFSLMLVYANLGLLLGLGIAACHFSGAFQDAAAYRLPKMPSSSLNEWWALLAPNIAPCLIILFSFLAFFIRIQSYTPIYQELDPYFYMYGARQILEAGYAPLVDDTAWYPAAYGHINHRTAPLTSYLESQWYVIYNGGTEYFNYSLSVISSFYPPIAAGLMVFFIYFLISQEYGRRHGLIAGALAAFIPVTIIKMAAGVTEVQPFSLFAIFFLFSAYALALKYKTDWRYYALTAFAVIVLLFGSNANQIIILVIPIFTAIHALLLLYRNEDMFHFMVLSFVYSATAFISQILFDLYQIGRVIEFPYQFAFGLAITIIFCAFPYFLMKKVTDRETRLYFVAAVAIAALAVLMFTPLFSKFLDAGRGAVSTIIFQQPLTRTIQEQGAAGGSFQGEAGLLSAGPDSIHAPFLTFLDGPVQAIASFLSTPATIAINALLSIADWAIGIVFGFTTKTSTKDVSLGMLFLFGAMLATLSAFARTVLSKHDKRFSHSDLFALYALIIFPISYVGLNRLKYTAFFALMLVVAASFSFGEFDKLLNYALRYIAKARKFGEEKKKRYVAFAFFGVFLLAFTFAVSSAFVPSPLAASLMQESGKVRYQDNPQAVAPKFQEICARLRLAGQSDDEVCKAGALDPASLNTQNINFQFSSRLCYLSIVSDVFAGATQSEQYAASFRCVRISPYWIEVMDWIEHTLGKDDRVASWWDYGHWTNFFGDKKTVLRNEHTSQPMIGMVASALIAKTPLELAKDMGYADSRYLMIDQEIVSGGGYSFGGKFGALNYLSCAYLNQTDVSHYPGESECEFEHTWEQVYAPKNPAPEEACTISSSQNIRGVLAYVPVRQKTAQGTQTIISPAYCIGQAKMADGSLNDRATYYLDRKKPNGDLVPNKAALIQPVDQNDRFYVFHSIYTNDRIWLSENGTAISGWEDRKGKFYDSAIYRGFYLNDIPGFELVYQTSGGEVKMFRLIEFTSPLAGQESAG